MLELQGVFGIFAISLIGAAVTFRFVMKPDAEPPVSDIATKNDTRFLYSGSDLLNACDSGEYLLDMAEGDRADWYQLAKLLSPRFPDFPVAPPPNLSGNPITLESDDVREKSTVLIEDIHGLTRVSLIDKTPDQTRSAADLHQRRIWETQIDTLNSAVQGSPYPIWQSDAQGQIRWANSAYEMLVRACLGANAEGLEPLFDLTGSKPPPSSRKRMSVTLKEGSEQLWYDVTSVLTGKFTMHYATDINAVVQAEVAQRNFVQTLTKTFAQLSIGLAIFDRKRELALFNPALTDLTHLSVDFLSNRPSLHTFFNRLRDNQTMPEPKNYNSWLEEMDDLIDATSDGNYLETWHMPSGLTYRVSGRPHPDGAMAFLFEDISAEMSLTRRFRADLELNQSVLDHLDLAVAVFSSGGSMYFCNDMYCEIWKTEPDHGLTEPSITESVRLWKAASLPSPRWDEIAQLVTNASPNCDQKVLIRLKDGTYLTTRAQRIGGGATMVQFDFGQQAGMQSKLVDSA
ncbi:Sensor protein DivL [Thalassovita gelatinovora]|uniref:Sensor protein DivL n=1 Tax=Thalassovita gelatinovora TaxID=53501 RepID=A0A0N7LV14_THAGE|nr:PAS-domain containing protein [Thalassovita gelatinovora]QIZ81033.1 diguanylate cyclase [Thalassovita gelatinovora]CUH65026.1 Sensor protein DivL [Thalassovita gelatinovora]SEP87769.1 PAS fold [Thalassovita gelatinovora]